jgi:tRNA pseudouridine13 synthase
MNPLGTGGTLKAKPEHFRVYEVPGRMPEGTGDHLWLWVEKCDMTSGRLIGRVADLVGVSAREVGCAGRKDRRAVTQQFLSVPSADGLPQDGVRVPDGEAGWWTILRRTPNPQKLRTGQVDGNRFELVISQVEAGALERAQAFVEAFRTHPFMPNAYGPQRFNSPEAEHRARSFLAGGRRPRSADDRFAISVLQSLVFNAYLVRRGWPEPPMIEGEWLKTGRGGLFRAERADSDIVARAEAFEVLPTGPMPGYKMRPAQAEAGELEAAVLADLDLAEADWRKLGKLGQGTRRPLAVRISDLAVADHSDGIELSFTLPSGSYATVLAARVMEGRWPTPITHFD